MLRRLLACLVAIAIVLPSAAMNANARPPVADCDCPPGKSDCGDKAKACDCGLACTMRLVVADPALAAATSPTTTTAFTDSRPMTRTVPPSAAPADAPFRPPRSTIPC
jgi:hypothetical protein